MGDVPGTIRFSSELDTVNHALAKGENTTSIEVAVGILDDYCEQEVAILLKLDVEGFEFQVLKGGAKTLANHQLKAIIIELNGSGGRYGIADDSIHQLLSDAGFLPFRYDAFSRGLTNLSTYNRNSNTIYVRDVEFVKGRVLNQRKIMVLGMEF